MGRWCRWALWIVFAQLGEKAFVKANCWCGGIIIKYLIVMVYAVYGGVLVGGKFFS